MGARKLHIGGTAPRTGWEILNAIPADYVDHMGKADDLSRFDECTFSEIYASHVLEHLGYQAALPAALAEWYRVLIPGGLLMVSVPDLDALCEIFCQRDTLGFDERFMLMRMMFGGQTDSYDFHYVGLNEEFLSRYLCNAGFSSLERVSTFGLFEDCSGITFQGKAISLNMKAFKARPLPSAQSAARPEIQSEGSSSQHAGSKPRQVGISAGWGSGYCAGDPYGSYAFKELAPCWIDYALLSQKQRPPRGREGAAFSYLELGSGMGLGLCLLAAAYPEGQFIGIDFHPSHIANSRWLVHELGLTNVQFYEADFLELTEGNSGLPFGSIFHADYVVAHGVLSWVSPAVRSAMFSLVREFLRPGGVFYCSYNTFPGWLDRTAFKALTDVERERLGAGNLLTAIDHATSKLTRLLQSSGRLAKCFPMLGSNLRRIASITQADYLSGEYGAEHWNPFYVTEVHQQASKYKLNFVASASLPDNFPSILSAQLAAFLTDEPDPSTRQLLLDLAINQSFRRDLFVKGALPLSTAAQQGPLSQLCIRATSAPPGDSEVAGTASRIETNLGTISDDSGRILQIESLLANHPLTLGEIHQVLGIPVDDLVLYTSLLLHAGRVGLDRGTAGDAARDVCCAVNSRMMKLMQAGHNLGFLAAPTVGHGAQPFSLIDVFALEALQQGLHDDILSSCVLMGIQATGADLYGPNGVLLTDPAQCLLSIQRDIDRFRMQTLPRLVQLGILNSPVPAT